MLLKTKFTMEWHPHSFSRKKNQSFPSHHWKGPMINSRNNNQHCRCLGGLAYRSLILTLKFWKLCLMIAKTFASISATGKSMVFSGNINQVELRSWGISSRSENRRWSTILPTWPYRQSSVKEMGRRWKWSRKNKHRLVRSKGPGS